MSRHNQNIPEENVRAFVKAAFGVPDIAGIERKDFERVIEYSSICAAISSSIKP